MTFAWYEKWWNSKRCFHDMIPDGWPEGVLVKLIYLPKSVIHLTNDKAALPVWPMREVQRRKKLFCTLMINIKKEIGSEEMQRTAIGRKNLQVALIWPIACHHVIAHKWQNTNRKASKLQCEREKDQLDSSALSWCEGKAIISCICIFLIDGSKFLLK